MLDGVPKLRRLDAFGAILLLSTAASACIYFAFSITSSTSTSSSADRQCLQGFFSDWKEVYPGTSHRFRTSGAFLSDSEGLKPSANHFTMVGSDDGNSFWTLHGTFDFPSPSSFIVDFSPKGGPSNLKGECDGADRIRWADGNSWWREPLAATLPGWIPERQTSMVDLKYLSQREAAALDAALMPTPGFSVEALTELSGLAVAHAVFEIYPPSEYPNVVAVIGPGGNGGDGMVATRHLASLGYSNVVAVYPKRSKRSVHINLAASLEQMGVPILDELPPDAAKETTTVLVDAVFGFSFRPPLRGSFGELIEAMSRFDKVVAVDVPSGWDVDRGPPPASSGAALRPSLLVSLAAPKLCAKAFRGEAHYLGKVIVPPSLGEAHKLVQPAAFGARQILRLAG